MTTLDNLEFVESVPRDIAFPAQSPLERARAKFIQEIEIQINLFKDPGFTLTKTVNKRDGSSTELTGRPRSWITTADGYTYITVRVSNKPVNIGGGKAGVIKCPVAKTIKTLQTIKAWAASPEADTLLKSMVEKSKRGKRVPRQRPN